MKSTLLLLFIVGILGFCLALPHPPTTAAPLKSTYDSRFDNINIDEILQQERLLKNYVKCLEGTGPCTADGKALKETLPDAIATDCAKCTEKQKYGSDKVTRFLIDNRPEDWQRLEKIYDPEGTYRKAYLAGKKQEAKEDTSTTTTTTKSEDESGDKE
ncbi:putative odorant-binding protein A10 [Stomoxys calcitrans]|uniref:putative odorant-binding protein A10 n=1 Tax=Stomoxys calcitrans TaxID=35570 RepID=UPI0027E2C9C4|nr:putative odorant-binding protein A10 [Stomoxys calcitrans]